MVVINDEFRGEVSSDSVYCLNMSEPVRLSAYQTVVTNIDINNRPTLQCIINDVPTLMVL